MKIRVNGVPVKWRKLIKRLIRGNYDHTIDGWMFHEDYAILYLNEVGRWPREYLPPTGVKGKNVLSIGGGCGEDAKFFLDSGASSVHVIENNPVCEKYLKHNSGLDKRLTYELKSVSIMDLVLKYDFIKCDIEGYESIFIPFLDLIKSDMIVESHCNYITDRYLEAGFKVATSEPVVNNSIYGGVKKLFRASRRGAPSQAAPPSTNHNKT